MPDIDELESSLELVPLDQVVNWLDQQLDQKMKRVVMECFKSCIAEGEATNDLSLPENQAVLKNTVLGMVETLRLADQAEQNPLPNPIKAKGGKWD
jgi:hypothetical protein